MGAPESRLSHYRYATNTLCPQPLLALRKSPQERQILQNNYGWACSYLASFCLRQRKTLARNRQDCHRCEAPSVPNKRSLGRPATARYGCYNLHVRTDERRSAIYVKSEPGASAASI